MLTKRKLITLLGALIVLIAAMGLVAYYKKESQASSQNAPPAIPVTAVAVTSRTMPVRLYAIGNVEPFTTVALKARVDGQIVSVHFKEGDEAPSALELAARDVKVAIDLDLIAGRHGGQHSTGRLLDFGRD